MFLLSVKSLKELQYNNILVLLYCSVEHLNVKVTEFSFIIWVAIAETLKIIPQIEYCLWKLRSFFFFFFN